MIITFTIIEVIVLLLAVGFCFYLFMDWVYPFFTNGKVTPGWLLRKADKKKTKLPENGIELEPEEKTEDKSINN